VITRQEEIFHHRQKKSLPNRSELYETTRPRATGMPRWPKEDRDGVRAIREHCAAEIAESPAYPEVIGDRKVGSSQRNLPL
jgi:hypothetical protein